MGDDLRPAVRELVDEGYTLLNYDISRLRAVYGGLEFTFEEFKELLLVLGISIRKNVALRTTEITIAGADKTKYKDTDKAETLAVLVRDLCKRMRVKKAPLTDIYNYISLAAKQNSYNPVIEMFEEDKPHNGNLTELCEIMGISNNPVYMDYLQRWMLQTISLQYNCQREAPIAADFVLVLAGPQGIGKTALLRKLAVKTEWFNEGVVIDMEDKDSRIKATRKPFCEIGELDSTTKKKQTSLKAFITQTVDIDRSPYGRTYEEYPRMTSFAASVNEAEFLHDLTGSRRYLVIELSKMDKDRLFSLDDEFIKGCWRHAYAIYMNNPEKWRMGDDLIRLTINKNEQFRRKVDFEQEIDEALNWEQPKENWRELTLTDLKAELVDYRVIPANADVKKMGRALRAMMKYRSGVEYRKSKAGRMYLLPSVRRSLNRHSYTGGIR